MPKTNTAIVKDDDLINIYANHFHLAWTQVDMRVRFGELMFMGDPSVNKLVVEERAGVSMSWAVAKNLRDSLTQLISKYEKQNGEIKPTTLVSAD